jgi:excisionase family DNA binding protein
VTFYFGAKNMETIIEQKFDRKQAASYLGVSVITVDRALADKKISCFRIGRRVVFNREHLDQFLKKNEIVAKK